MTPLALLLAAAAPEFSAADLDRFPSWTTCHTQIAHCNEHLLRLRVLAGVRGWRGQGEHTRAVEQLEFHVQYWRQLELCHQFRSWPSEGCLLMGLAGLKKLTGPAGYFHGWRPCLMPPWHCPELPEPLPPPEPMPPAR